MLCMAWGRRRRLTSSILILLHQTVQSRLHISRSYLCQQVLGLPVPDLEGVLTLRGSRVSYTIDHLFLVGKYLVQGLLHPSALDLQLVDKLPCFSGFPQVLLGHPRLARKLLPVKYFQPLFQRGLGCLYPIACVVDDSRLFVGNSVLHLRDDLNCVSSVICATFSLPRTIVTLTHKKSLLLCGAIFESAH